MAILYSSLAKPLVEILSNSSNNAIYVIPDLQRPYIWNPEQVILLIDSLFRGWPFGAFLVWEVNHEINDSDEGIPPRSFWTIVDRTDQNNGTMVNMQARPANYYMILDGQQRIQSFLLALCGDNWGFKLFDSDWNAYKNKERRGRKSVNWSEASLFLDCDAFQKEYCDKNSRVSNIEINKFLDWVIIDRNHTSSNRDHYPLEVLTENPGRFIRLSRLWNLAEPGSTESNYRELLNDLLTEYAFPLDNADQLKNSLAEFLHIIEDVKYNTEVKILQISRLVEHRCTKDEYFDAIVNVFTRLNAAGRTLSKEDITLAWLKVGWINNSVSAGGFIRELMEKLKSITDKVEVNDVVRMISFLWASTNVDRRGELLDSKDLLKGEIIRPMAEAVASDCLRIKECVEKVVDLIEKRNIDENIGSFNAIIVAIALYNVYHKKSPGPNLNEVQRDNIKRQADEVFNSFIDRWIYTTEWSKIWGDIKNFPVFAKIIYDFASTINNLSERNDIISSFKYTSEKLLDEDRVNVKTKALHEIEDTGELKRERVHRYKSLLWIWHRLDNDRYESSKITLRDTTRKRVKIEVDHIVSHQKWTEEIITGLDDNIKSKIIELLRNYNISIDIENIVEYLKGELINSLGNCCLLEKNFNISKGKKSMWSFLSDIDKFNEDDDFRDHWQESLGLTDSLTEPTLDSILKTIESIIKRDRFIKAELKKFVNGEIFRHDL